MAEGFTSDLIFEAGVMALLALLIVWRDMPLILAVPAVLWRIGVTTVYFAEFFDGSLCVVDDLIYDSGSVALLHGGWNPVSVLIRPEGLDALVNLAEGGSHTLYFWWTLCSMYLFGEHYYAPVFLNVLLTFVTGMLLNRIANLLGFSPTYRIGLELFFLLHWDILYWSSFINLKECLVQMLTVADIYFIVRFCQKRDWWSAAGFGLIVQLFYWIRFYLSTLMLISTALWAFWQWRDPRKFLLLPIACVGTYATLQGLDDNLSHIQIGHFVYGLSVMLLAPIPWLHIDFSENSWPLAVAATFHIVFLLPCVYGTWQLWQASRMARLFIIYLLVVLVFYAIVEWDFSRGPRQRSQLSFIFAWIQFQFLWSLRPLPTAQAVPAGHVTGNVGSRSAQRPTVATI